MDLTKLYEEWNLNHVHARDNQISQHQLSVIVDTVLRTVCPKGDCLGDDV